MLPTFQNSTCTCHCCTDARTNARLFSLLLKVSLTINCISLAHKAYINKDYSMVTFLFFAYFGFLALELCCAALSKLPPDEGDSTRQNTLKLVVCGLYVFLAVGFMYQIGRSFPFATSLLLLAVLSGLTALGYYECFTQQFQGDHVNCKPGNRTTCSTRDFSRSRFAFQVREGCIECSIRMFWCWKSLFHWYY